MDPGSEAAALRADESERAEIPVFLSDIAPGMRARVVKVGGRGETSRRIVDMGITSGTLVKVERVAPLGDPMEVEVKGYHLSLRRSEASRILVEPV